MPIVPDVSMQKQYDKNSDIKPTDIQRIREWMIEQPHLPYEFITDHDLILAYYSCEYDDELTKKVIDLNYTLRTLFAFYQNRRIDRSLEVAVHTWLVTPLDTPTTKGYRAMYCQLLDADPNKFVYADVVRAFVMVMDLWMQEEGTVPGVTVILNMDNVALAHLSRINLSVAQQFFYFLQEAMFVRLKEFHFINASNFMDTLMSMVSVFMKKELIDMLRVHQAGSATLEEFIPVAALPKEVGGMNNPGAELRDDIWNKLKSNEKFFEEESKKRVNESHRPGGPKNINSLTGSLEGFFKKLEID